MKRNVALEKSYAFALRIIKLYKYLVNEHHEYVLSKQILKSGTSIGANLEEAQAGQSARDFIAKTSISHKEARETHYWIRLLRDSEYIDEKLATSFLNDCDELLNIIGTILKTTKANLKSKTMKRIKN